MKVLKITLFIIAVLILLFVMLGFLGPRTYDVSRTAVINAPKDIVYSQVSSLSNMANWDPWKENDPTMMVTSHGDDSAIGSYRRWESENSGIGEQKITKLVPNELVETELRFIEPFEAKSIGYAKLEETENGIYLIQGFMGENNFMNRAMSMIGMDMDAMVGPMFEKGLLNLKKIAEVQATERSESLIKELKSKYSFGIQDRPASSFVLKRDNVPFDQMAIFYAAHFPRIATAVAASGAEILGRPCGVYYARDEVNSMADMCAAIHIADVNVKIEGYETVTMPAGRAVKVAYYGAYEGIGEAHYAMDDFIKSKGLELNGPVIEQYITDPMSEADTSMWLTNVYYPVK
jgi:effector-binding domain-containing protein